MLLLLLLLLLPSPSHALLHLMGSHSNYISDIFNVPASNNADGSWSIGRLAFFGGCYGTVIGILDLLPPASIFKIFTPLAGMNMIFVFLFAFVTMVIESSGDTISASLKGAILHQCKALETIWGRGFFYLYIGITCILAPGHNLFGVYMLFVGTVMLVIYKMTSGHLAKMGEIFKDEKVLVAAFNKRDVNMGGSLDRVEMVTLLKEDLGLDLVSVPLRYLLYLFQSKKNCGTSTVPLIFLFVLLALRPCAFLPSPSLLRQSHAELEMMMNRLDANHDNEITLKEMKAVLGKELRRLFS